MAVNVLLPLASVTFVAANVLSKWRLAAFVVFTVRFVAVLVVFPATVNVPGTSPLNDCHLFSRDIESLAIHWSHPEIPELHLCLSKAAQDGRRQQPETSDVRFCCL